MKKIISIQGNKNSGKDTVAIFIKYILETPSFLHNYQIAKFLKFKSFKNRWFITRYAEKLKEVLSIILNVPVEKFEDREFKENKYFNFETCKFVDNPRIISDTNFNRSVKKGNLNIFTEYDLSVRQILQAFGTDLMRKYLGDKLWINLTLNQNYDNIIIADQRFIIENETVQDNEGIIIHITRPGCEAGKHPSEKEIKKLYQKNQYDYIIDNAGSLEDLFNECKYICGLL